MSRRKCAVCCRRGRRGFTRLADPADPGHAHHVCTDLGACLGRRQRARHHRQRGLARGDAIGALAGATVLLGAAAVTLVVLAARPHPHPPAPGYPPPAYTCGPVTHPRSHYYAPGPDGRPYRFSYVSPVRVPGKDRIGECYNP